VSLSRLPSAAQFHTDPPVAMAWPDGPAPEGDLLLDVDSGRIEFTLADFPAGDVIIADIQLHVECGDADGNDLVNVSDAVYLIGYIFGGGSEPQPMAAGDVDCNSLVNVSDAVYLIAFIFGGGSQPCDPDGDQAPDC
jgi:hypothetical protein